MAYSGRVGQFELLVFRRVQVGAEAGAAAGLIYASGPDDYQLAAVAQTLRVDSRRAANDAHRRQLRDVVGNRHQRRNRTKRLPGEGGVEPGDQDALAHVDQLAGQMHDRCIEELAFVDADDFNVLKLL